MNKKEDYTSVLRGNAVILQKNNMKNITLESKDPVHVIRIIYYT